MRALLVITCLFLIRCDQVEIDFFDLGGFRVMALVADQPEVDADMGATVNITPWISDIDAAGRNISLTIVACPDPGVALGEEPTCDQSDSLTQTITYADFDNATLSGQRFTGAIPSFAVNIPPGLTSSLSSQAQYNGIDYIVSIVFTAGDEVVPAFKRIKVSNNPNPNQNPKLDAIEVDGDANKVPVEGSVVTFSAANGFAAEDYQRYNQDGELEDLTESYITTWFVYSGTLTLSRSESEDKAQFQDDIDNLEAPLIVGVLRDGRGGLDVMIQ